MGFHLRTIFTLLLTLSIVSFISCTRNVKETRFTTQDPAFSMIVASDSTEFKDTIRHRIVENYRNRGNIEIINIEGLEKVNPRDVDVVLIMDTCLAWSNFNPSLTSFLEKHDDKQNVVLLVTAGDPEWTYSYQGVDAITSASEMENEEAVYQEIVRQIDGLVSR